MWDGIYVSLSGKGQGKRVVLLYTEVIKWELIAIQILFISLRLFGSAVFIRDDLKVKGISICEEDDVELITIELCNAIIQYVYKPPNEQFLLRHEACSLMGILNNRNIW